MYSVVKIGDREIPMLSMASVDLYYKNIFHEDPMEIQTSMDAVRAVKFYHQMAFVMAKFAELHERKEMLKLTEDSYFEWLDTVDRGGLFDAVESIQQVYDGQKTSTATAKKNEEQSTEK